MRRPGDTSPEAERVLREVYRKMPIGQKWLILGEMYRDAQALHAAGVRLSKPDATPVQIRAAWIKSHFGLALSPPREPEAGSDVMQNLVGVRAVTAVFSRLGIPYALGGSTASSLYGIPRYTRDADLTAEPFPGREAEFAQAFDADYYLSVPAIADAIRRRSSFNIINSVTGFKVDVYIRSDDPFEVSAMQRRVASEFSDASGQPLYVQSAEDVILFKCRWYRLADEALDQQWQDILGIFRTRADELDDVYLDRWAGHLGVADLLARARQESLPG
jgi:hypothetical protein